MGRHSCCYKQKLRKGLWSPEEDEKLYNHVTKYGHGCWSSVPKLAGLQRCGKSCRLRWINYLRPDLKRGTFSQHEEDVIIELHAALGNRWSQIAAQLPGRTDNEIKNLWNSCIKKKLIQRGIDPSTHKPLSETAPPAPEPAPAKELLLDPFPASGSTGYFDCFHYWEGGNSSNNSSCSGNSASGIELYDGGVFGLEDIKWSEYINGSAPITTPARTEGQACNVFEHIDGFGAWQQSHQHLHSSDFYGKEFQRSNDAFGHI